MGQAHTIKPDGILIYMSLAFRRTANKCTAFVAIESHHHVVARNRHVVPVSFYKPGLKPNCTIHSNGEAHSPVLQFFVNGSHEDVIVNGEGNHARFHHPPTPRIPCVESKEPLMRMRWRLRSREGKPQMACKISSPSRQDEKTDFPIGIEERGRGGAGVDGTNSERGDLELGRSIPWI